MSWKGFHYRDETMRLHAKQLIHRFRERLQIGARETACEQSSLQNNRVYLKRVPPQRAVTAPPAAPAWYEASNGNVEKPNYHGNQKQHDEPGK